METVYLDYNATTPLEPQVIECINSAMVEAWGNPSSSHGTGLKAKELIQMSRQYVANMINSIDQDIVFTSGGTESNNMILNTAVKHFWNTYPKCADTGDVTQSDLLPHIITSNLEHDSIKLVLEEFQKQQIADVTYVAANKKSGRVETEDVICVIRPTTCMVSIMLANNETGIIQPVAAISRHIRQIKRDSKHACKILIHTDAAQAFGKISVDVLDLGVDYLTIVGHKFYGPRIGAVYTRGLGVDNNLYPMLYGGGQEQNYRPGTENTAMIAGLGKASELVVDNLTIYQDHMRTTRDYLERRLLELFPNQIIINGDYEGSERLPNTCNISFLDARLQGNKVLSLLRNTQASVGAACHSSAGCRASPILVASGVSPDIALNALRLSVGRETSTSDIDIVIEDLTQAVHKLTSNNS